VTVTATPIPMLNDNYSWMLRESVSGKVAIVDPAEAAPAIAATQPIAISNPTLRRHPIMSAHFMSCIASRLLCFVLPQLSCPNEESRGLISADKQQRQSAFLTIHKPFRRKRG